MANIWTQKTDSCIVTQIAKLVGPTLGQRRACPPNVDPTSAQPTSLSGDCRGVWFIRLAVFSLTCYAITWKCFPALLVLCVGNPPINGDGFPSQMVKSQHRSHNYTLQTNSFLCLPNTYLNAKNWAHIFEARNGRYIADTVFKIHLLKWNAYIALEFVPNGPRVTKRDQKFK